VPSPVCGAERSTPDRSRPYLTDATVDMHPAATMPRVDIMPLANRHEGVSLAGSSDPEVVPRAGRRCRNVSGLLPAGRSIGPRRAEPVDPRADGTRRAGRRRYLQDGGH